MGIYINGIEMPKDKPITLFVLTNGNVYADGIILAGKAAPVPQHGDLIDRNKIEYTYAMQGGVLMTSNKIIDRLPIIIPSDVGET